MSQDKGSSSTAYGVFRDVLQRIPVALTLADPALDDVPIVAANDAFATLCGHPIDQIEGRNCRFLQGDFENEEARFEIRGALEEQRRAQVVLHNRRADGTAFDNFLTIVPIHPPGLEITFILGAQFLLKDNEVAQLATGASTISERQMMAALSQKRATTFEQRRLLIEAAVRSVQGAMIMRMT